MKKLGIMITALFAVMTFCATSFAAVQVTLTSPTIVMEGCERAGAVQFTFPIGTVFTEGDWWYMDLNTAGTTICSPIDYVIAGAVGPVDLSGASSTVDVNGLVGTGLVGAKLAAGTGPLTEGTVTLGVGDIAFRVQAAANSNRVLFTVIGSVADANASVTVADLNLKVLDGKEWNTAAVGTDFILTNNLDAASIIYGDTVGGVIDEIDPGTVAEEPAKQNTLCINAESAASGTIFTSFASKADFLTFTGDSQIAHQGTAASITLANCKGAITGNIEPASQGSCEFDYEASTNYCAAPSFLGNRMLIESTSTFGQSGDKYDMSVEVLTNGVYFSADPAIFGYTSAMDNCTVAGTALTFATPFKQWAGTDDTGLSYDNSGSCALDADERIDKVTTSGGSLDDLWMYNSLRVDFGTLVYDTTIQGPGEIQVKAVISKYPCGELFSGTLTVGTFVEECTSAATPTTTLVFPYLPPLDGSAAGWWSGYVITNAGTGSGTINLVYSDMDGNTGTYTTGVVAAGAMFNGTGITAADLSSAASYDASDNHSIVATCNFIGGVGFAFIGNGREGTGYAVTP